MQLLNIFKTKENTTSTNTSKIETEVLYSNKENINIIEGIELPPKWQTLNKTELINKAKETIIALSKSSNPNFKAKELGFNDAEHLIKLCFDYILKYCCPIKHKNSKILILKSINKPNSF